MLPEIETLVELSKCTNYSEYYFMLARTLNGCLPALLILQHHWSISITETSPYKSDPNDFHLTYSKNGGNLGSESK